jgi:hypothetical protein
MLYLQKQVIPAKSRMTAQGYSLIRGMDDDTAQGHKKNTFTYQKAH